MGGGQGGGDTDTLVVFPPAPRKKSWPAAPADIAWRTMATDAGAAGPDRPVARGNDGSAPDAGWPSVDGLGGHADGLARLIH